MMLTFDKKKKENGCGSFLFVAFSLTAAVVSVNGLQLQTSGPKGSAAFPQQKKKIAVIGPGGYTGGITFGFLQRASSLYGTGIDYQCRAMGGTSQTSKYLNGVLGRHFALAQADESFVKLTNFADTKAIQYQLDQCDAVIFSTDMMTEVRPVTFGTYETSPNTKTNEIFWDYRTIQQTTPINIEDNAVKVEKILDQILEACQLSHANDKLKHVLVVGSEVSQRDVVQSRLSSSSSKNVPYTFLRYKGELETYPSYTYRKGVIGNLIIDNDSNNNNQQNNDSDNDNDNPFAETTTTTTSSTLKDNKQIDTSFLFREDLAALSVQCLMSLDWEKSYNLSVKCDGREAVANNDNNKNKRGARKLRPDQQWCINSKLLEDKLSNLI